MEKLDLYRVLQPNLKENGTDWELVSLYKTRRLYELDWRSNKQILEQLTVAGDLISYKQQDVLIEGNRDKLAIYNSHNGKPIFYLERE